MHLLKLFHPNLWKHGTFHQAFHKQNAVLYQVQLDELPSMFSMSEKPYLWSLLCDA